MNEIIIPGRIDDSGKMKISPDMEYLNFLNEHKGRRVRIIIDVFNGKDTTLNEWYFRNVVIPKMKAGLLKVGYQFTDKQTEEFVHDNCPFYDENMDTGKWFMLIEWAKQYSVENFDIVIKDLKDDKG